MLRIRDWEKHFERDRTRQWKKISWVPVPNKQGRGYRKIMAEKNGLEIFACWIAIVEAASLCDIRGDLSKYSMDDLSLITCISKQKLEAAIKYLSEVLDWIEVTKNLDVTVNDLDVTVNDLDVSALQSPVDSSILFNSIQSNSIQFNSGKEESDKVGEVRTKFMKPTVQEISDYCKERGNSVDPQAFFDFYESKGWRIGNQPMKNWQAAVRTWEKRGTSTGPEARRYGKQAPTRTDIQSVLDWRPNDGPKFI